jgi:hypothetical protein
MASSPVVASPIPTESFSITHHMTIPVATIESKKAKPSIAENLSHVC